MMYRRCRDVRRLGIEVKTDIREQLQAEAEAQAEYVYILSSYPSRIVYIDNDCCLNNNWIY
jgi:hypothetical protein